MTDIKAQIKHYSNQAVVLSKKAQQASKQDFARGKTLMKQAHQASQNCQSLIHQYQESLEPQSKS